MLPNHSINLKHLIISTMALSLIVVLVSLIFTLTQISALNKPISPPEAPVSAHRPLEKALERLTQETLVN